MKAELSEDGQSFTLTRGAWSNSYPLADLPKWLAFYRDGNPAARRIRGTHPDAPEASS